jgi:peptidoglycan/LPS O-acetylase OafA/YrhL
VKHNANFFWLDVIRGVSALIVCTGHLRAMLFTDYSELKSVTLFHKAFYLVTGLGHQSVVVFFVLSGFLVGGSVLRKAQNFSWVDYAIARLTRLWIVLVPALMLTFIIDQFIGIAAPELLGGSYHSIWLSGPSSWGTYSNSLSTFFGNIFFLQTILTPVFGTNEPLWSLANEFWYYILFPLCAYAAGKCYGLRKPCLFLRAAVAVVAFTIFMLLPSEMQMGYFNWLLGVITYISFKRFERSQKVTRALSIVGAITFIAALVYSKSIALQEMLIIPSDIIVGLGFSVFCLALVNLPHPPTEYKLMTRTAQCLSEISYSLYLSHFPLVIAIGALFYRTNQLLPNLYGFIHFFAWLGYLVTIGVTFWWLFERRTNKLKKFVVERLFYPQNLSS